MPSNIAGELAATFDLAIRRHEAKSLTTGEDWKAFGEIENRFETARTESEARYREEYRTRFEKARQDIIDEKASPAHTIRTPFGTDRFDKDMIARQAHRRVERDHQAELAAIDAAEGARIEALMRDAEERHALKTVARDDFNRSADRRSGPDRRGPRRSY
ncbi:hypothetical protein FJU08_00725 [Martelella alba]|uniref:Uncharacterized protein n=1 Tax=Martelella alba TaxID=2590451 RepID=A0A506UIH5_9HYPH|nr:hypothetical protein [Martelella alba]TPW33125.1 hypothetical protein FJU08_00725 [Martelella alba]